MRYSFEYIWGLSYSEAFPNIISLVEERLRKEGLKDAEIYGLQPIDGGLFFIFQISLGQFTHLDSLVRLAMHFGARLSDIRIDASQQDRILLEVINADFRVSYGRRFEPK